MKEPLERLVRRLEEDLREHVAAQEKLRQDLEEEYEKARQAGRTGEAFEVFCDGQRTLAAVAWVLAAVFVRFLEDNGLLDEAGTGKVRWIAGDELALVELAREREREYFRRQPQHGEREYLWHVFEQVGKLPGMERLFDRAHTPLWRLGLSADGARELIDAFRRRDPASGEVLLRFGRPGLETRFLGDLYQDLSEAARKRYALLQTPEFVERFLLDRSLEPAIAEWGLETVRVIDPACGSGHFLLGAFERLLERHRLRAPAENPRVLAQQALDQVAGVDVNPFAAAIARFRLLVAALAACGIRSLAGAPNFRLWVGAGDSLLHGRRPGTRGRTAELFERREVVGEEGEHYFASEDADLLREVFGRRYHVVVGNPPYITVQDPGLRQMYRERFESCHGQFSLVCPFVERVFDLAVEGGYVALIVGNAFMKRQFGKPLVEEILRRWDLTHVIDTAGAYIPGHGTPTVMLLGRARTPVGSTVRAVMGIRGEPVTPEDPAHGQVWSAILGQIDRVGSQSEWVSVEDVLRTQLEQHPWSLQGGGAGDLRKALESKAAAPLEQVIEPPIGRAVRIAQEEIFFFDSQKVRRLKLPHEEFRGLLIGENVRDWAGEASTQVWYPYVETAENSAVTRQLWKWKRTLLERKTFSGALSNSGLRWYEYQQHTASAYRTPLSIAFAFVSTHNHFVLDRGGKVFNRSAPVIKLPSGASEDDHLGLVGLLNSSTACFWMKQVFTGKHMGDGGEAHGTPEYQRFEFEGTKLQQFPLPTGRPLDLARALDDLAHRLQACRPEALCAREVPSRQGLDTARAEHLRIRRQMISLQEELDWRCYGLYGLLSEDLTSAEPPAIELGERAFEIHLARQMAAGEAESRWFERHGSTPITELPGHWPEGYRQLVQRRLQAIAEHAGTRLIERPEYKRRWSSEPWETLEAEALRTWLLDRLEQPDLWQELRLLSTAHLADRVRRDPAFGQVAALYRGHTNFDLTKLITELVQEEGVPFLARQRYKPAGLRKREVWEQVWELQRREDAASEPLDLHIPVPPKYSRADFLTATGWRLRGKLDVPKERFVLYPGAERAADPSPVLGWAGWDPLERARALAAYYVEARDQEAWPPERLAPLLDGLEELLPWLLQWHNEVDPAYGTGLGTYFKGFLAEERRR